MEDERDKYKTPIHFTGELKHWLTLKQAVGALADCHDYSWEFDKGAALCLREGVAQNFCSFVRKIHPPTRLRPKFFCVRARQ